MTATDVGTLVAPGVILDRRTQDELRAPCDAHLALRTVSAADRCQRPADWIVRVHIKAVTAPDPLLLCDQHLREIRDHLRSCRMCSQLASVTTEPLR